MVQFPVFVMLNIALKRLIGMRPEVTEHGLEFPINQFYGDALVLAVTGIVIGTAAVTYHLVESPWRDAGRRLVSRDVQTKPIDVISP